MLAPIQIAIALGARAVHTHIGSEVPVCCGIQVSNELRDEQVTVGTYPYRTNFPLLRPPRCLLRMGFLAASVTKKAQQKRVVESHAIKISMKYFDGLVGLNVLIHLCRLGIVASSIALFFPGVHQRRNALCSMVIIGLTLKHLSKASWFGTIVLELSTKCI